jgi:hypothetical protein
MMTKNIGGVDTAIRAVLGTFVMVLAAVAADQHPFVAFGTALIATAILITAIAGVCPLYTALGIDTYPQWSPQPRTETRRELAGQLR